MTDPREAPRESLLITGASSGIGAALARRYAAPGRLLALTGRDLQRLEAVAGACRARGASVVARQLDVLEREAMAAFVAEIEVLAPLSLVIANAGISAGTGADSEPPEQLRRITATNVEGVINTVEPAVIAMRGRGRGQVGLVSSLAGFRGFPGAPAYCASKAWVRVWGEALRAHLATEGVGVSVICPGFVETRMTAANGFRMPLLWSAERAAEHIMNGLGRNRARIAFPLRLYWAVRFLAALPPSWTDRLLRRLPTKASSVS